MTSNMDSKQAQSYYKSDQVSEPRQKSSSEEETVPHEYAPSIEPLQIHVSSTFDADMILRKIIEDRSAILALRSEAERNEKELLKAKVWQMQTSEQLLNAEKEISRHVAKAKYDIAEYNESSKQYINGFVAAFQNGEIEKLSHHPFLPSLKDLEEAIARRKALVIEKVQADDRVRKLEIISSRHHIAKTVLKKNEEAFVRAIAIAKQQFSDSCGSWLQQFEVLVSNLPDKNKVSVHLQGRHHAPLGNSMTHENLHVKRPRQSHEDQNDTCKRKKTVADLRHDHHETSSSASPVSLPALSPHNNTESTAAAAAAAVSHANSDFMDDMAIAEALTRLGS